VVEGQADAVRGRHRHLAPDEQQFRALPRSADAGDELWELREHLLENCLAAVVGLAECGQLLADREEDGVIAHAAHHTRPPHRDDGTTRPSLDGRSVARAASLERPTARARGAATDTDRAVSQTSENGWWFWLVDAKSWRSLQDVVREYVEERAVDADDAEMAEEDDDE
jgi:hypothetical protein